MKPNKTALPVLFILVILGALGIDLFLPSFPNMMEYFKINKNQIQLTISIYILFYGLGQLLIGGYSDKKGRRASALIGLSLYFLGSIIGASSDEFNLLLIGRALQGLGGASTTVSAMAWVRENFSQKESVKWLSYMVGAIGIIPAFAPFLGSTLADSFGWQSTFIFKATLGFILFWGVYYLVPKGTSVQATAGECGFKGIISDKLFRRYNLTAMVGMGAILTYTANAPIVAMEYGNLNEYQFSILFGSLGLGQLIIALISPKIAFKIGQENTVIIGIVLAFLSAFSFFYIEKEAIILYFLFSGLGLLGVSLMFGPTLALTLTNFSKCAGKATSFDGFLKMTGAALITALMNSISSNAVFSTGLAFLLFIIPLGFILFSLKKVSSKIYTF